MSPIESDVPIFHQHRYAQELDRLVVQGASWLDIGAGHRVHSGWLGVSGEELAARASYFAGCDLGEDVLEHPLLHDRRIASATDLPWESERFDVVSANMVLEHVPDPSAVFAEARRVLRSGGAFVFVTPNRLHPIVFAASIIVPPRLRRLFAIHVQRRPKHEVFVTEYRCNSVRRIRTLATESGLQIEVLEPFVSVPPMLPNPLGALEAAIGRFMARRPLFRGLGADIITVLRKP